MEKPLPEEDNSGGGELSITNESDALENVGILWVSGRALSR
jgi:hypothetical protein